MYMKKLLIAAVIAPAFLVTACNNSESETASTTDTVSTETVVTTTNYVDLSTGSNIDVKKDETSGKMVNVATNEPVEFYVDLNTRDTFFGYTGTVVNNTLARSEDGKWEFDGNKAKWDGNELKIEYADGSKVKADEDEYKYKSADGKTKVKVDGDDKKIKTPDVKIKEKDGEVRVKER